MISQCLAFVGGYTIFGHFVLATGPSIGVHPSWSDNSCLEAGVLNSSYLFKHFCFFLDDELMDPTIACKGQCLLEQSVWALTSVTTRC